MSTAGEWLRERRKAAELRPHELASLLNVSVTAINNWERGASRPDMSRLSDLAGALRVEMVEIVERFAGAKVARGGA